MNEGPPEGWSAHGRQAGRHAEQPRGNGAEKAGARAGGSGRSVAADLLQEHAGPGARSACPGTLEIGVVDVDTFKSRLLISSSPTSSWDSCHRPPICSF